MELTDNGAQILVLCNKYTKSNKIFVLISDLISEIYYNHV